MKKVPFLLLALTLSIGLCGFSATAAPKLENLGKPISFSIFDVFGITRNDAGDATVWAIVRSPEQRGVVGTEVKSGKSRFVDLGKYDSSRLQARVIGNKVYAVMCAKNRGIFVEYNPATGKLRDFPLDAELKAGYFMQISGDFTADGKYYVGVYPETQLCWLDTKTGKTGFTPRFSTNKRQNYLNSVAVDRNTGIVYAAAGLNTPEVFSYDPATGKFRQIIDEKYLIEGKKSSVALGGDGGVYVNAAGKRFRCTPDAAIEVDAVPPLDRRTAKFHLPFDLNVSETMTAEAFDSNCRLILKNTATGEKTIVQSDFPIVNPLVYSICGGLDHRIWVGSFTPAAIASFDGSAQEPEYTNYGKMSTGSVQVYWTLETPKNTYTSSYSAGAIDRLDLKAKKFKKLLTLSDSSKEQQERIFMLIPAADGKIYGPTMPIKSILGGGIVELDPATENYVFYRNVIKNQSIRALAAAPGNLLFGVSDVSGGTSAIASEKEAKIFLWDTATKQVVWEEVAVPGEKTYLGAYPVSASKFWTVGTSTRTVVLFDAAARKVEKTIRLPEGYSGLRPVGSAPALGNRAVLLLGDSLFDVDFDSGKITKVLSSPAIEAKFKGSLHGTHAEYMAPDGSVYFGSESSLYRVRMK
jgi:hypothetical protein